MAKQLNIFERERLVLAGAGKLIRTIEESVGPTPNRDRAVEHIRAAIAEVFLAVPTTTDARALVEVSPNEDETQNAGG